MSVDVNTFEKITIRNSNAMTKAVAVEFGEYLLETWGIDFLDLTVDGKHYETEEESLEEDSELAEVCRHLGEAESIEATLQSENDGGLAWRLESCFLSLLTDDEDLKKNVTYKSTDYYDSDTVLDLFCFDENGVEEVEYNKTAEAIQDIKEWFCYTHEVQFSSEEEFDEHTRDAITEILRQFINELSDTGYNDIDADENEIYLNGSLFFKTENIPAMADLLQKAVDAAEGLDDVEGMIEIYAVPNGPDDYKFASVSFTLDEGKVNVGYCRF